MRLSGSRPGSHDVEVGGTSTGILTGLHMSSTQRREKESWLLFRRGARVTEAPRIAHPAAQRLRLGALSLALIDHEGLLSFKDGVLGDDNLFDVGLRRDFEHYLEHQVLKDGA